MRNDISDEEFLAWVLKVGARIAPHLKTKPLSQQQWEDLDRRLKAHRPTVCELTDAQMKVEILKLLASGKPMDGVQIVAALRKEAYRLKGADDIAIYGLLWQLEEEGLLCSEKERTAPETEIIEYEITNKGRAQLEMAGVKERESATLRSTQLGKSAATE